MTSTGRQIEQRSAVAEIVATSNATVQARVALLAIEDRMPDVLEGWHRMSFPPGINVAKQIAIVNTNLEAMGRAPLGQIGVAEIESVCAAAHTPEAIAAYREAMEQAV